jgi:ATP-binding cassette subfamily C protein
VRTLGLRTVSVGAAFLSDLCRWPGLLATAFLLLVASSLSEGITFVLLIPLLGFVGLVPASGESGHLQAFLHKLNSGAGVAPRLELVLGLFVLLMLVRATLGYAFSVASVQLETGFLDHVRRRLYRSFSRSSWLYLVSSRSSHDTHALTLQAERVGHAVYYALHLAASLLTICAGVAVAWLASPRLTLAVVGAATALALPLALFHGWAFERGAAALTAMQHLYEVLTARVDGLKLAKSFSIETVLEREFAAASNAYRMAVNGIRENAARASILQQAGAALVLGVFVYAAIRIFGASSLELILLIAIFARMLPRANDLQSGMRSLAAILPEYESLRSLEATARAAEEALPERRVPVPLRRSIGLRNVSFRYPGQRDGWALSEVSFELPARSAIGIVGLSGAGKSTLSDLLAGLMEPSRGELVVDGMPIDSGSRPHWRSGVAYVAQDTPLFHDTIRANLLLGAHDVADDELWRLLELAQARDLVRQLPAGLDTVVGDRGLRLSGGERQRLRLASALLRNPELLILDEATSALNPIDERGIIRALRDLLERTTVVMVAHRLSSVAWADHLIVLERGRVVEVAPTALIMRNHGGLVSEMRRTHVAPAAAE